MERVRLPFVIGSRSTAHRPSEKVTYLGHATFILESADRAIVTDPMFADRVGRIFTPRSRPLKFDLNSIPPPAAVLISHAHHDHLDYRSLKQFGKQVPLIVPWGVSRGLRLRGFSNVRIARPWDELTIDDTRVVAVPARHFGGRLPIPFGSGYQGYVISSTASVYFAGDTGFDAPLFREIGRRFDVDLALLPIAGYLAPWFTRNHMNAEQAVEAFRILGGKRMVPMHFETFTASFEAAPEPRRRLLAAAEHEGVRDSIAFLSSGEQLVLD